MVKEPAAAAASGEYLTLIPVKAGLEPLESVMSKVLAGIVDRGPWGSLRIFKVWSPVFVTVATTLRLSTPLTDSGPIRKFSNYGWVV